MIAQLHAWPGNIWNELQIKELPNQPNPSTKERKRRSGMLVCMCTYGARDAFDVFVSFLIFSPSCGYSNVCGIGDSLAG